MYKDEIIIIKLLNCSQMIFIEGITLLRKSLYIKSEYKITHEIILL